MPEQKPEFSMGDTVWAWSEPGRWFAATVIGMAESACMVRPAKVDLPDNVNVPLNWVRHRDFARHGADRPRRKPQ